MKSPGETLIEMCDLIDRRFEGIRQCLKAMHSVMETMNERLRLIEEAIDDNDESWLGN